MLACSHPGLCVCMFAVLVLIVSGFTLLFSFSVVIHHAHSSVISRHCPGHHPSFLIKISFFSSTCMLTLLLPQLSLVCSMLYNCHSSSPHLNYPYVTFNHRLSSFCLVYFSPVTFSSTPGLCPLFLMFVHLTFALCSTL